MSEHLQVKCVFRYRPSDFRTKTIREAIREAFDGGLELGYPVNEIEIIGYHRNPRGNLAKPWTVSEGEAQVQAFFLTLNAALAAARAVILVGAFRNLPTEKLDRKRDKSEAAKRGWETRRQESARVEQSRPARERAARSRGVWSRYNAIKREHPTWNRKRIWANYRKGRK